jgi:hypothetical protein
MKMDRYTSPTVRVDDLASAIELASQECKESTVMTGEYGTAFHVAYIVLDNLARKIRNASEDRTEQGEVTPSQGDTSQP